MVIDDISSLCETYYSDFEKMKQWYDGYTIKGVGSVCNPNSVMEAVAKAIEMVQ